MKKFGFRIVLTVICCILMAQTVWATDYLVPGGQVIGLDIQDHSVTVAAFDETLGAAAKDCGLQIGDRITAINGKSVRCAQDIRDHLKCTDGEAEISIIRGKDTKKLRIKPAITQDGPKLGVFLKQGITGVGTVTWYDPETGAFGALGHGVNDPNGSLVAMEKGNVYPASVVTVRTGKAGDPGQLMSTVTGGGIIGTLRKNTAQGVFGTAQFSQNAEKLPVGEKEQIHTGTAVIRSTVAGNTAQEYSVEILKIYANSGNTGRNMLLKVTDPQLLAATGGIVQGMSGSPIIQDGKLIGAVTHVLVNDPTTGYGIFIENMLDAAA